MATPYDQIGGLLGQFAVPEDERRKQQAMAMIMASLQFAGSRKGQELQNLAPAMAAGLGTYYGGMNEARQAKRGQIVDATGALNLNERLQAANEGSADRAFMQGYKPPGAVIPPGGPTNANAAAMAAAPASGTYEKLLDIADKAEASGRIKLAEQYRTMAEKYAPKYKGTETVMKDGKPILLQQYENRAPSEMNYQPKPDFAEVDTGGAKQFVNKYNLPNDGAIFSKTLTPEGASSRELGLKNYGLAAGHLALAQDKAKQEKGEAFGTPIQITTPEGGTQLMIPRKGTNQVVPMTDAEGNPVTKSASIPQAYKEKAYNLANLRDNITAYSESIKNLSPTDLINPAKMAEIKAKYGASQMGLKNLFELGVIAGPDMQIMAQNLTDPASLAGVIGMAGGGLKEQNKVLFKMIDNADRNLASSYNQPVRNKTSGSSAAHLSDEQLRKALGL